MFTNYIRNSGNMTGSKTDVVCNTEPGQDKTCSRVDNTIQAKNSYTFNGTTMHPLRCNNASVALQQRMKFHKKNTLPTNLT